MRNCLFLVVLLVTAVPSQPFHFSLLWKGGTVSSPVKPCRGALATMQSNTNGAKTSFEGDRGKPTCKSLVDKLRCASTLASLSVLLATAQPAGAYVQSMCPGGAHVNHFRGSATKAVQPAVHDSVPKTKGSLNTERCSAFPADDSEAVLVASTLEGVVKTSIAHEEALPALSQKSIEDLDPLQNMGFAFVASAVSTMAMHPVDTMKTRIQRKKRGDTSSSAHHGSLYHGLLANVAREGPCNALYLGVYEAVKKMLFRNPSTIGIAQHWPMMAFLAAGAIGDCAGCLVSMPAEIVKRKVQAGVSSGYAEAVVDAVRSKSARAMTLASAGAVMVRDVPEGALQMALYEEWKLSALPALHAMLPALDGLVLDGLVGAAAGGVAAVLTTPLDVVLTRLSTQDGDEFEAGTGVRTCMRDILDEEGMAGLWKGAAHRAGYYAPLIGIFFAAFGWLQSLAVDEGRARVLVHSLQADVGQILHLADVGHLM